MQREYEAYVSSPLIAQMGGTTCYKMKWYMVSV